jgi:hypothetical protein
LVEGGGFVTPDYRDIMNLREDRRSWNLQACEQKASGRVEKWRERMDKYVVGSGRNSDTLKTELVSVL